MANGGRIDYTIGFKTDTSGLNQIKQDLSEISKLSATDILRLNPDLSTMNEARSVLQTVRTDVEKINQAYENAFDSTTGVTNIQKLNTELNKNGLNLQKIQTDFSKLGVTGQQAFTKIAASALTMNVKLKHTQNIVDKMGETLVNTLKWSISSSVINTFTNSIQQAWGYVQHLDTSLNDIRIVTGKSAEEMDNFAVKANNAASALGAATTEYTEAALIYYQQGLSDEEANARAETTLKAANVTGQTGREVSEELTAVWNGYKVTAEETELYVDKLAAVAATTASDLEELSTGMSKVASAANNMGVDIDQLNAQLSTIISVTRQAPETAGTALKTIYARMEDLKINGEDEDGVKLGEVSSTLDEVGVHVMDTAGNLRDLGEVIEEVGNKWETWTNAQQSAIAQAIAGKRQYNNLLALFDNWDMYNSALETSANATGTLQKQQDTYMESTAAHVQQLKTQWEDFYDSLFDTKSMNELIDSASGLLSVFTNLLDAIGGGKGLLITFGAIFTKVFSKTIGQQIGNIVNNFKNLNANMRVFNNLKANVSDWSKAFKQGLDSEPAKKMLEVQQKIVNVWDLMTESEKEASQEIVKQIGELENEKLQLQDNQDLLSKYLSESSSKELQGLSNKGFIVEDESTPGATSAERNKVITALEKEEETVNELKQAHKELSKARSEAAGTSYKNKDDKIDSYREAADQVKILKANLQTLKKLDLPDEEVKKYEKALDEAATAAAKLNKNSNNNDYKSVNTAMNKALSIGDNLIKQAGTNVKTLKANVQEGTKAFKDLEQEEKRLEENLDLPQLETQKFVQGISNISSSLLSLTSSITSFSTAFSVWGDESLSFGDKISQSFTSILSGVSMLGMSLSGIKSGLIEVSVATGVFTAAQEAEKLSLGEVVIALLAKKLGIELVEKATVSYNAKLILATTLSKIFKSETLASTVAQAAQAKTAEEQAIALTGLNAVLTKTTIVLAAVTVAIGLVVTAIKIANKKREEELQSIRNNNEAIRESNRVRSEEIEKNKELANSLEELVNQYKSGTISAEDFYSKKAQLLLAMDEESRIALSTANNWSSAEEALASYRAELAKQEKENAQENADTYFYDLLTNTNKGKNFDTKTSTYTTNAIDTNSKGIEEIREYMAEQGQNLDDIVETVFKQNGREYTTKLELSINANEDLDTFLSFIEAINTLKQSGTVLPETWVKQAEAFTSSEEYKNLKQERDTEKTSAETEAGLRSGIETATTIEEGQQAYERFKTQLIEDAQYSVEEAEDAWLKYLSGVDTEVAKQMSQTELQFERMTQSFKSKFMGSFEDSEYNQYAQQVLEYLQSKDLGEGITLIEPEEWEQMLLGQNMTPEEIGEKIKTKLQESLTNSFADFKASTSAIADSMQSLITENIDGAVDLSEDGAYQTLKNNIETLISYYPELTDQANVFNNTALIGTQQWTDALYDLQDAFNDLELDVLTDQYDTDLEKLQRRLENIGTISAEYYDENGFFKGIDEFGNEISEEDVKIRVEADMDEFTSDIEAIMDDDYSIRVEVNADIQDDFDNIVSSMENMDSMAEKIGEDFIVSAEDITEIAAAYPGILQGYTDLGDGTIQLNEEIAQSAMDAASQAEIASVEELQTEIENTNAELELKKNHYQAIIDIATNAGTTEEDLKKAVTDVDAELLEIQNLNQQETSQNEMDNAYSVATDSQANAEIVANNWAEAYQSMATSSYEAAKAAIANAKAVADENADGLSEVTISANFTGSAGSKSTIDTDSPNLQTSSSASDNQAYLDEIADYAQQQIDAIDAEIAANEALMVEATARLGDSVTTNSSVGTSDDDDSSSSSSSEDEADTEEYLEREEDLYRAINEQLDDIESKLGRIDTIESHSWGADYLDTLEEENELLTAQLDLLETKKSTYESDLSSQQATLSSYGVTFSEDGSVMTNAEDVLDSLYSEYNSMVDSYNSMSADAQDDYQDTLDSQKDYIDSIEDAIDSYEDAYSEYNSVLDDLLDTHYELIENAVNQFNTTIDVHLELDEAETEWNEFWYEVVQDVQDTDFSGLFEESIAKLTTLVGTTGNTSSSQVAELTTHLNDTITEVQKQIAGADIGGGDSIFGDDTALSKETLETYRDSLIDAVTSAKEEIDTMQENYLKALDDAQDKIDEQVEGWEAVGDHIEHNIELIQMVSGSKAFEPLNKQFEQQYKNNLNLIETQKISQDYWKERMEYYEQMMATEEEGSQMYQTYSDALEKASENYRSAVKDLDSAVKQALDDLEDWRKNQVSALEDTLDKALSSGMGLDDMQSEWDLILEKQNFYLDNVERALEMQDLEKDFSDVLDTLTTRNDLQQEFLKFQDEELSRLQQKDKLTQFDIDELRARLEIRKAELALEEAQQNKSNLRLRRDSQGNYTYQYTANPEDTEDAEDGIMSAKREWYELVKKRQEEVAENAIDVGKRIKDAWNEYQQALADEDDIAAENAKSRYEELVDYQKNIMGEGEVAKQLFYQGTADFFRDVNERDYLPIWNTTIEGMIDKWSNGGETSFIGAVSKGITDLDNLQQNFSDKTNEILTTAGVNYENLVNNGIDPTTEALEDMNGSNEELNETLDETNSLLDTLESELQDAIDAYDSLKDAAVAAIQAANQELETLSQTAITAIDEINNATSTATSAVSAAASSASSNSGSSSSGTGTSSSSGTTYKFVKTTSSGSGDTTSSYGALGKIVKVENGVESVEASGDVTYLSQYKKKKGISVTGLATGGYTGEWTNGSEDGRLAFLHQKELVLNESDTENILNAVTAVRDLVGSQGSQNIDIEGISNSIIRSGYITAQVLAQVGTNMLQAIASMVNNNNSEVQNYRNMTVNADFSGVRSADAIYQALMDLDNYGSQQAYSNAPDMNIRY